jgi:asparagine synthetase B (glutamine-hydrolysing)
MLGLASVQSRLVELDLNATVEYLTFGFALDNHTLIRNIHMLENAAIVKFRNGRCYLEKYWIPNFTRLQKIKDKNEVAEELNIAIDNAVDRYCSDGNIGLAISAGLDSRHIAARIPNRIKLAVVNGNPISHEVKGAKRVCDQINIPMEISYYDVMQFATTYSDAIIANDGLINTPEYLIISKLLSEKCDVAIFGAYGNGIRGHIGPDLIWKHGDLERTKIDLFKAANREYIQFSESKHAFGSKIDTNLIKYARDTFWASFDKFNFDQLYNISLWQDVYYRNRRRIFPALGVGHRYMENRFPYTDNDLLEFAYSIPWEMKVRADVYRLGFIKRFPELAKIPNALGQNYFYEAKYGWIRNMKRNIYHASPSLVKYFLKPVLPKHPSPANYDVYQTALKEETIRSLISLSDYNILKRSFIEKILKEQFTGYVNRYTLMHKLVTLSCLIDGTGIWKGMSIP